MSDIIKLLPDSIANQIAAGEVVQRPASVIKELLENSIDAGATHIKLLIKEAGKKLIQVVDNGYGMSETDARMSFERHATSKIKNINDLFALKTMGFRGEALASIAAVAQVEMKTRTHASDLGTHLIIEASEVKSQTNCQCSVGTGIWVKNLFYNVPARRNFLKSDTIETRHIIEEFLRITLANPHIAFELHNNETKTYNLPQANLRKRIVDIMGASYNEKLIPIEETTEYVRLYGFVGKPELYRKTRGEQYFFVNQRFIKSPYLHSAVMHAYDTLLPTQTFPFYVIFIEINPAKIDVNVHPTKQEIKFDDERMLYAIMNATVKNSINIFCLAPSLDFETETEMQNFERVNNLKTNSYNDTSKTTQFNKSAYNFLPKNDNPPKNWQNLYEIARKDNTNNPNFETHNSIEPDANLRLPTTITIQSNFDSTDNYLIDSQTGEVIANAQTIFNDSNTANPQNSEKLWQLHQKYIFVAIKSGVLIIDQQLAHEKILYEKFFQQIENQTPKTQIQLFAQQIELSPLLLPIFEELKPALQLLGYKFSEIKDNKIDIEGIPATLIPNNFNEKNVIENLLQQFEQNNYTNLKNERNHLVAKHLAQTQSIKKGKVLTTEEMKNLLDNLFALPNPNISLQGKPIFVTQTINDFEKIFGNQ